MATDKQLIASQQQWEQYHISFKYKIPLLVVRAAMKVAGRSRKKVYAELRKQGYVIKTKFTK